MMELKSSREREALTAAIGRTLMRWQDATQKYDEAVGEMHGLSASERLCLSLLWQGPQTASAIAREIRLTPAAVTALVDRLERRGFVRRRSDPGDRRKVIVETAAAAQRLAEDAYQPLAEAGSDMLSRYSEAELRVAMAVLEEATAIQEAALVRLLARARRADP